MFIIQQQTNTQSINNLNLKIVLLKNRMFPPCRISNFDERWKSSPPILRRDRKQWSDHVLKEDVVRKGFPWGMIDNSIVLLHVFFYHVVLRKVAIVGENIILPEIMKWLKDKRNNEMAKRQKK